MKFPQSNALKKTFGLREFPINRRTPDETDCLEGHRISTHVLLLEDDLSAEYPDTPSDSFLPTSSARRTTPTTPGERWGIGYFYPRPPRGGRPGLMTEDLTNGLFLSTSSARRTTSMCAAEAAEILISIHVLREEDDQAGLLRAGRAGNFYPRPPRGGRHWSDIIEAAKLFDISIHVLREEDDTSSPIWFSALDNFYPRPPRGGRRAMILFQNSIVVRFLSTSSARRTTVQSYGLIFQLVNFYPRPPRGVRPSKPKPKTRTQTISIHVLREEDDEHREHYDSIETVFLSTSSARRTTLLSKRR